MKDSLKEYKCPCCGGAIAFDSGAMKMKCPYCDTEFEMETLRSFDDDLLSDLDDDMSWDTSAGGDWESGETDGLRVYVCKSCGGEIAADENTAASSCPFCGNNVVMKGNLSGVLRPDLVIPFRLDKNAAKEGLMKYLSGKRLLPKLFREEAHINEIKGIYVPFWLFDSDAEARIRFRGTKVRVWSDRNYNYTATDHYSMVRSGSISFDRVPVDGSSRMADDLMESIEPYSFKDAVDFQTAYLAGFFADKYDVSAEDSVERANSRVKKSAEYAFTETVQGYATVVPESESIRLRGGRTRYALCPVWILNTVWQGKNYVFAMNGQTGKFVGDLPVDRAAALRWTVGLTAAAGAAAYGVAWLLWLLRIL